MGKTEVRTRTPSPLVGHLCWRREIRTVSRRYSLLLDKSPGTVRSDGPGAKPEVTLVDVVLAAGILPDFFARFSQHPGSRIGKGPRIELGILDQRFHMYMIAVRPRPALDHV